MYVLFHPSDLLCHDLPIRFLAPMLGARAMA
jgi:hypothetical protein